jgi:hypothetical protein
MIVSKATNLAWTDIWTLGAILYELAAGVTRRAAPSRRTPDTSRFRGLQ